MRIGGNVMGNTTWPFVLSVLTISVAQPYLIAQRSIPDDNLAYPVRIDLSDCRNQNTTPQGSGFFLNTGREQYLVTARHVLFNVAEQLQPNHGPSLLCKKAQLISYSRDPKESQQNKFELDLERLNNDGKVKSHSTKDVAVVQIGASGIGSTSAQPAGPTLSEMTTFPGVTIAAHAPAGILSVGIDSVKKLDDVLAANDVYVLGYPSSIGIQQAPQIDYNTPLIRKGVVAGINRSNKTVVLDCMTFFGNSGGPVLQVSHAGLGTRFDVIGVVSQYVPFTETWVNMTMSYANMQFHNSGYSIAEPMDGVLELIGK